MMKVGDKLICKVNFSDNIKGNICTITSIYNKKIFTWFSVNYNNPRFSIEEDQYGRSYKDFFYTQEEMRKLKLDSL